MSEQRLSPEAASKIGEQLKKAFDYQPEKDEKPIASEFADKATEEKKKDKETIEKLQKENEEQKKVIEKFKGDIKILKEQFLINEKSNLPNEEALLKFVEGYDTRQPYPILASYLDMQNFKQINDKFGHKVGDQKIREAGSYLNKSKREIDALFHLHGDEFVILSIPTQQSGIYNNKKITPKEGLESHLRDICEHSEIKFDFATVEFNSDKHSSLQDTITEADENMLKIKEIRKQNQNFSSNLSASE